MKRCFLVGLGWLTITTELFADAPAADPMGSSALTQVMFLAAFAVIFYFIFIRPQSKRAKEHRSMLTALQKGDEVVTSGGLLGKITKVTEDFFMLSIAEGTEVVIQKQAIAGSLPKGTLKNI
jgi:preprotein translocase subunit YajC